MPKLIDAEAAKAAILDRANKYELYPGGYEAGVYRGLKKAMNCLDALPDASESQQAGDGAEEKT